VTLLFPVVAGHGLLRQYGPPGKVLGPCYGVLFGLSFVPLLNPASSPSAGLVFYLAFSGSVGPPLFPSPPFSAPFQPFHPCGTRRAAGCVIAPFGPDDFSVFNFFFFRFCPPVPSRQSFLVQLLYHRRSPYFGFGVLGLLGSPSFPEIFSRHFSAGGFFPRPLSAPDVTQLVLLPPTHIPSRATAYFFVDPFVIFSGVCSNGSLIQPPRPFFLFMVFISPLPG